MDRIIKPIIRRLGVFSILLILVLMFGLNVAAGGPDYMVSHLLKEKPLVSGNAPRARSSYGPPQHYEQNAPYGPKYPVPGNTTNSTTGEQSPAEDKIFFPPYKFPYWGLPYGIYSKGGLFNPGLFPFVPGGPAFPPFDGIFGGPFGPGHFPGGGPEPFQGPGNSTKDAKSAPSGDDSPYKTPAYEQEYEKPKKSKKKKKKKPCCTSTTTSTTPSTTTAAYDDSYQSYYSHDMPPDSGYPGRRYPPPRHYGYPPPRSHYNSYGSGRGYNPRKRPPPNYGSMRSYYNEDYYYESSTTPSTTTTAAYSTTAAPVSNAQTIMYLSPGYQSQPMYHPPPPVYPALSPQNPYGPVTVQNFYGAQGYQTQPYHNPYAFASQYAPHPMPQMQYPAPSPYGMPLPYPNQQPQYFPYPYPAPVPQQIPYQIPTTEPSTTTTTTTTPATTTTQYTTTTTSTTPAPYYHPTTSTTPAPYYHPTTSATPAPYYPTSSSTTPSRYHSYYFPEVSVVKSEPYTSTSENPNPYNMPSEVLKNQYYVSSTTPKPLKEYNSYHDASTHHYPNYPYENRQVSNTTVKPGKMYTLVDIDYFRDNKISSTTSSPAPNSQNYFIQMPSTSSSPIISKSTNSFSSTNSENYSYSALMPVYSSSSTTEHAFQYPISTSVSKTVSQKLYSGSADSMYTINKTKEIPKPDNYRSIPTDKPANRKSYDSPTYKTSTTSTTPSYAEYEEFEAYEDYPVPDNPTPKPKSATASRSGRSFIFPSEPRKRPRRLQYKQLKPKGVRIVRTQNNNTNETNVFLAPNATMVLPKQRESRKPSYFRSIRLSTNSSNPVSQKLNDTSPKLSNTSSYNKRHHLRVHNEIYTNFTIGKEIKPDIKLINQTKLEKNESSSSSDYMHPNFNNKTTNNAENDSTDAKFPSNVETPKSNSSKNMTSKSTVSNLKHESKIYHKVTKFSDSSSIKISETILRPKNLTDIVNKA